MKAEFLMLRIEDGDVKIILKRPGPVVVIAATDIATIGDARTLCRLLGVPLREALERGAVVAFTATLLA